MGSTKIGILTFQDTTNYGACLQSIALVRMICEMGYDCEIIWYECENIVKRELPVNLFRSDVFLNPKEFISKLFQIKKYRRIKAFMNKYGKYSEKRYNRSTIHLANNEYDKFISGSDIIWELNVTRGDYSFFLDFVIDNKRKFSYSSSFGYEVIPEEYLVSSKRLLAQYELISTRERNGAEMIYDAIGKHVPITLDPTLLFRAEKWVSFEEKKSINRKYVLLYFDDSNHKALEFAKELCRKNGLMLIHLTDIISITLGVKNLRNVRVGQFLWLIHHAEYVVTGSYHGVVYSINYHTPFFYVNRAHQGRINTVVESLEIKNKDILSPDGTDSFFDWDKIDEKLERLREDSTNYLWEILKR